MRISAARTLRTGRLTMSIVGSAAVLAVSCACSGGANSVGDHTSSSAPTPSPTVTWSPVNDVSISGRAAEPTDTEAPGIVAGPSSTISLQIGNDTISIGGNDWNTITGSSVVPKNVTVSIDPGFHASATTRARFQYLADLIGEHFPQAPTEYGIFTSAAPGSPGQVVTVAGLVNPGSEAVEWDGLDVTVTQGTPPSTVTQSSFYHADGTHLSVGPNSVYFAWLVSPQTAPPVKGPTTWDFHHTIRNCGAAAC